MKIFKSSLIIGQVAPTIIDPKVETRWNLIIIKLNLSVMKIKKIIIWKIPQIFLIKIFPNLNLKFNKDS